MSCRSRPLTRLASNASASAASRSCPAPLRPFDAQPAANQAMCFLPASSESLYVSIRDILSESECPRPRSYIYRYIYIACGTDSVPHGVRVRPSEIESRNQALWESKRQVRSRRVGETTISRSRAASSTAMARFETHSDLTQMAAVEGRWWAPAHGERRVVGMGPGWRSPQDQPNDRGIECLF